MKTRILKEDAVDKLNKTVAQYEKTIKDLTDKKKINRTRKNQFRKKK